VIEEVAWVRESSVSVLFVLRHHLLFPRVVVVITATTVGVAIIENYDFVYAENGEGSRYLTDQGSLLIMGLAASVSQSLSGVLRKYLVERTDLATILPGNATLTVYDLPVVGLKTAVGFVVSSLLLIMFFVAGAVLSRLRFCRLRQPEVRNVKHSGAYL
jgi:hypothetical protein